MFSIKKRCVFITGGSSGIGRAVAERFAMAGARIVIADTTPPPDDFVGAGTIYLPVDVGDESSVQDALAEAARRIGKLDCLIPNAGVGDVGKSLEEVDAATVEKLIRVNQLGVLNCLKHGPGQMNDGGSIIVTSSRGALSSSPGAGIYNMTKRAILALTEMSAMELAERGIRCNAVCPSYVDTAMGGTDVGHKLAQAFVPLGRIGTTDDLTGLYHFLASDESAYITGQTFVVDGGWGTGPAPQLLERIIGTRRVGRPADD